MFRIVVCDVLAENLVQRTIWRNLHLYSKIANEKVDVAYFPVYDMPITKTNAFPTIVTIHDLQALHFRQYFPFVYNLIFRISWRNVVKHATRIITISNFVKDDLYNNYQVKCPVDVVYNPIVLNDKNSMPIEVLEEKYLLKRNEYYYTLSSVLPHKNLMTLVKVFHQLCTTNSSLPCKLFVSGINSNKLGEIGEYIQKHDLKDSIVFTGFISNEERNAFIKNSRMFLFPSTFEGFGMPPIESMMLGTKVLTTNCASLKEVTKGKCYYINDPYDVDEWIAKMEKYNNVDVAPINFPEYDMKVITKHILQLIRETAKK